MRHLRVRYLLTRYTENRKEPIIMASKIYTLVLTESGERIEFGSKKTAVKKGEEAGVSYQVLSPSSQVVESVIVASPEVLEDVTGEPEEEPQEDLIGETPGETHEDGIVFHEHLDFPGNYSIVMAPFAVEIADAAGVPTLTETFAGKLTRRVYFGGRKALATKVKERVEEEAEKAKAHLHQWQKDNIENRRGLTDMQRYVQHREVLANFGHDVAAKIKKSGL